jgi:DNA-directed RNA polymerase subunit M/transcription elongation factor TFIIS
MEKTLFTERLDSLGHFRKREGTDPQFVPNPTVNLCEVCKHGWLLFIEKKRAHNDRPYWRYKCNNCKQTWQEKPL